MSVIHSVNVKQFEVILLLLDTIFRYFPCGCGVSLIELDVKKRIVLYVDQT